MQTKTSITRTAGPAAGCFPAERGSVTPAHGIVSEHPIPATERPGCDPYPVPQNNFGSEPSLILIRDEGADTRRLSRSNPLVYEAIRVLKEHGFLPVRVTESSLPVNLIGLRKSRSLLVRVLRSRRPVPSAAVLHAIFKEDVEMLCRLAGLVPYQIMIWVSSPSCGWLYYLVYPGGLRRDLDFPGSLDK
nr:hypothetical protein [uncultured Methanoregula sp.]